MGYGLYEFVCGGRRGCMYVCMDTIYNYICAGLGAVLINIILTYIYNVFLCSI